VYKNVVLDTDVVIHLLRHSAETVKPFTQFHQAGTLFLLSPIVITEIYVGAFAEEYVTIEDFFSLCEFAPITAELVYFTERPHQVIRIFSSRLATKKERHDYETHTYF